MINTSSLSMCIKEATIKNLALTELARTRELRNILAKKVSENSIIGGSLSWLNKKGFPGSASAHALYTELHNNALKADTALGAIMRGNAQEGSLRHQLFTTDIGSVPVQGSKDLRRTIPRATIMKPLKYTAEAAVLPLATVGIESLRDNEEDVSQYPLGGL